MGANDVIEKKSLGEDEAVGEKSEKIEEKSLEDDSPKDCYHFVYILFFLIGIVNLQPYTFFNSATAYYMYKFRNTTSNDTHAEDRSPLQANYNAALTISLQLSDVVFLILGSFVAHLIKVKHRLSLVLVIITALFVVSTAAVEINTDSWQMEFFTLTITSASIINASNAILSITMATLLAIFPHDYMAAFMNGGALASLLNAVLQILSLSTGMSTINSALFYFCCGSFIVILTLVSTIIVLMKNTYFTHHIKLLTEGKKDRMPTLQESKFVLTKIWSCLVILACYLLTTDLSPTNLIVSVDENGGVWNKVYFVPTITYLFGGLCRLIGTAAAFKIPLKLSQTMWSIVSIVRMAILIPLMLMCNAQPRHHLPVIIDQDYLYGIMVFINHFSGGYISATASSNIRSLVPEEHLKSALHIYIIFVGILMGSFSALSLLTVQII